jgi:hypothetical protein
MFGVPPTSISLTKEENYMARTKAAPKTVEPVTVTDARKWLLAHQDEWPVNVSVGIKGRLSAAARSFYEAQPNHGPIA